MTIRYASRTGARVAVLTSCRRWSLRQSIAVLAGLLVLALAAAQVSATEPYRVWTWGANDEGQLGDGTTDYSDVPVVVSSLAVNASKVAGGDYHTVARSSTGTVYAWGGNGYGQLGDGSWDSQLEPVPLSGLPTVRAVAAGGYSSAALDLAGNVWTWGDNWSGQLGIGELETVPASNVPVMVVGPGGSGVLDDVKAIACGGWFMVALKNDGTVWTWGNSMFGQLGNGSFTYSETPVQVSNLTDVKAIAAGYYHCVAVKNDGTVWTWGDNTYGQLGDNTTDASSVPVQVSGLSNVDSVGAGGNHSLAIKDDYTVWAWGANESGQLGDGTTDEHHTPVQMLLPVDAEAVAGGYQHTVIKATNRWIYACGNNSAGQIGDGTNDDRLTPVRVQDLRKDVVVACGGWHTVTVIEDLITYTLNLTASPSTLGSVAVTPNQTVFNEDDLVTIEAHANPGKFFTGWDGLPSEILSETTSATGSIIQFNIHENLDITGMFEPQMVWFDYSATEGGIVYSSSLSPGRYELTEPALQSLMRAMPSSTTYGFLMWTINGEPAGTSTSLIAYLSQDTYVVAVFGLRRTVTVNVSPVGAGSVTKTPNKTTYVDGQMLTLQAQANAGYVFSSWDGLPAGEISGLSSGDGSVISFYVSANHVITANFVSSTVQLTYGDHTGGDITGDGEGTYPRNSTVNLHASAHPNYRFVKWLVNDEDGGTDPDLELLLDENKTVGAVFVYQYTLTVVNGTGSGVYDDGSLVEIVADYPQAEFDQWVGDVATVENVLSATTNILVNGDYTVTATPSSVPPFEVAVSTEDDLDWVYQNLPSTIENGGHRIWLEVTVVHWGDNDSVTVEVVKEPDSGPGTVTIEDDEDPLVKWIVGPMRTAGAAGSGDLVLTVTVTGNVEGQQVIQVPITARVLGDIDGNGGAEPSDLSIMINKLNGMPSPLIIARAYDLDLNGGAEPGDMSLLINILNGLR